jgi:quinol monooxygenase YgiN
MTVLVSAEVPGQTIEGYDAIMAALMEPLRRAKGFIAHGAGPSGDGWHTFEIWETADDATRFFAEHIRPHLPPDIRPQRRILELHNYVQL